MSGETVTMSSIAPLTGSEEETSRARPRLEEHHSSDSSVFTIASSTASTEATNHDDDYFADQTCHQSIQDDPHPLDTTERPPPASRALSDDPPGSANTIRPTAHTSRQQSLPTLTTSLRHLNFNSSSSNELSSPSDIGPSSSVSGGSHNPWRTTADEYSPSISHSSHFFAQPQPRMVRSMSSTSSRSGLTRPSSSSTTSTFASDYLQSISCRPWVKDSDCSSVSSANTGGTASENVSDNGDSFSGPSSFDPEVYKVIDNVEFLDPRPEPAGAKLVLHRDDPSQIVIRVTLPGFSLDNITVAMRRGHKVHIVADKYGEDGGHFEKLISLGSEASSAAPRAEFNGTVLSVFVARRLSSSSNDHVRPEASPSLSSSDASGTSTPFFSDSSPEEIDGPVVARSSGSNAAKRPGRSLTGPEGAKAAAKAAKEEAARRAKEQAKTLPRIGKCLFPGSHWSTASTKTPSSTTADEHETNSVTPKPASPVGQSTLSKESIPTPSTLRPKMRESNLTLRPDSGSFAEAAQLQAQASGGPAATDGDTVPTPRVERESMDFA